MEISSPSPQERINNLKLMMERVESEDSIITAAKVILFAKNLLDEETFEGYENKKTRLRNHISLYKGITLLALKDYITKNITDKWVDYFEKKISYVSSRIYENMLLAEYPEEVKTFSYLPKSSIINILKKNRNSKTPIKDALGNNMGIREARKKSKQISLGNPTKRRTVNKKFKENNQGTALDRARKKVREKRIEIGLKQYELAELADLHSYQVSYFERGVRYSRKTDTMQKLMYKLFNALEIPTDSILLTDNNANSTNNTNKNEPRKLDNNTKEKPKCSTEDENPIKETIKEYLNNIISIIDNGNYIEIYNPLTLHRNYSIYITLCDNVHIIVHDNGVTYKRFKSTKPDEEVISYIRNDLLKPFSGLFINENNEISTGKVSSEDMVECIKSIMNAQVYIDMKTSNII